MNTTTIRLTIDTLDEIVRVIESSTENRDEIAPLLTCFNEVRTVIVEVGQTLNYINEGKNESATEQHQQRSAIRESENQGTIEPPTDRTD